MKYLNANFIILLFTLFSSHIFYGQSNESLSPTLQKAIIKELSYLIQREYILEDVGIKMASHLNKRIVNNVSTESINTTVFLEQINNELQSIFKDKHLSLINKDKYVQLKQMFGIGQDDDLDQPENHGKQPENHGKQPENHKGSKFNNSDDLKGSRVINRDGRTEIGLLKINQFVGTEEGIYRMNELFKTFIGVDVIIIDLRNCKGGDADMVKILSGYFFEEPTHLVTTIGRKDNEGNRSVQKRWSVKNSLSTHFSNIPLYLLTSSSTFSAAESFAFGLQLNGRVKIIGENTGGGGHMNTFFDLPGGYGVSISVGRTFDEKTGLGFQSKGIIPNKSIEANHAFSEALSLIKEERTKQLAYEPEKEKIHQTLLSFSEAWYNGESHKAELMLHEKFKAYINDANLIEEVDVIELIKNGIGSKTPREVRNRMITIYETKYEKTASARLMFRDQIHYLHLVNDNGRWRIISDLIVKKQRHS
jgi:retinol-binding protein 3